MGQALSTSPTHRGLARFWHRLWFRSNRTPRAWVRRWVFDARFNPKPLWRWAVLDADRQPRAAFAAWLQRAQQNLPLGPQNLWLQARQRALSTPRTVRAVTVVCAPQTHFVALMLAHHLNALGFHTLVQTGQPLGESDAWVLVGAQGMFALPPREKRVVLQMEQSVSSRWFTEDYLNVLANSLMVWDYATTNLAYLARSGVPQTLLHHVPISTVPFVGPSESGGTDAPPDWDVLFYGDVKVERRQRFLDALGREFRLHIGTDLYGDRLARALRQARVVVNIHYYENALLETTRLCECLSHGARVVSEMSSDMAEQDLFTSLITFTPLGDVASMVAAVRAALHSPPTPQADMAPLVSATAQQLSLAVQVLGWTPPSN